MPCHKDVLARVGIFPLKHCDKENLAFQKSPWQLIYPKEEYSWSYSSNHTYNDVSKRKCILNSPLRHRNIFHLIQRIKFSLPHRSGSRVPTNSSTSPYRSGYWTGAPRNQCKTSHLLQSPLDDVLSWFIIIPILFFSKHQGMSSFFLSYARKLLLSARILIIFSPLLKSLKHTHFFEL